MWGAWSHSAAESLGGSRVGTNAGNFVPNARRPRAFGDAAAYPDSMPLDDSCMSLSRDIPCPRSSYTEHATLHPRVTSASSTRRPRDL